MVKRNHKQDTIDNSIIEVARPVVKLKPKVIKSIRYYYRVYAGYIYIYDRATNDKLASCTDWDFVYKLVDMLNAEESIKNSNSN